MQKPTNQTELLPSWILNKKAKIQETRIGVGIWHYEKNGVAALNKVARKATAVTIGFEYNWSWWTEVRMQEP